jgi:quinol monooxygenase YgiN
MAADYDLLGGDRMSEPLVVISHFAIKEGGLDDLKRLTVEAVDIVRDEKPRTVLYLSYLDEDGRISFLHAFPDADAFDQHLEGTNERAAAAFEFMEPRGWEFYGKASEQALEGMRATAARFGVPLTIEPEFNAGFLRLGTP